MKKVVLLMLITAFGYVVEAQTIKVASEESKKAIENVTVTGTPSGKSGVTNANGEIELSTFDSNDTLSFKLDGYDDKRVTIAELAAGGYTLALAESGHHLEEVVITETSNAHKEILYQPVSVVKLGVPEIKRGQGVFMDDAINTNVPGVMMERRSVSGGQQFNIRGYGNGIGVRGANNNFDSQGIKMYLNGIPVTDAEGITIMDDIDFGSVSNVEVVKGPSGTLYGLAIAGVINMQTQKAERNKVSIGQDVMIGDYGLRRYTTRLQVGGERSSVLVNYGKQLSDGFMAHNNSTKDFVNVTADFQLNNRQSVTSYLGYSNSYDQRGGELTMAQYQKKDYSGNAVYIKNNAHSEIVGFRAGLGHTYLFTKNFSNTTSVFGSGNKNTASSAAGWTDKTPTNVGFRSTFDTKFNLGSKFRLSGITGVEAQVQTAQTIGYNMVADSSNLAGYNIIGAAKSNMATTNTTYNGFTEWTLAMPYEFALTAGVGASVMDIQLQDRFYSALNNNPSNPKGTHNPTTYGAKYDNMVAPHIALNKVFSKRMSAYVSYSTGYRAPVSSNLFIAATGKVNTDLKPEMGTQIEIGTKGSLLGDKLIYQVSAFDAIFSNKMTVVAVPNPANTATLYTYLTNGGKQEHKGIEVLLKYNAYQSSTGFLQYVRPFANLTYSDFKYVDYKFQSVAANKVVTADYSGKAVAGVAPLVYNLGIDVSTNPGLYANVNYSYRDAMPITSDGVNKTSDFGLLNAKIGFQRTFFKHLGVDLYFGANNITNTQYYNMVFVNQLPDAYIAAPDKINYFGGANVKYTF